MVHIGRRLGLNTSRLSQSPFSIHNFTFFCSAPPPIPIHKPLLPQSLQRTKSNGWRPPAMSTPSLSGVSPQFMFFLFWLQFEPLRRRFEILGFAGHGCLLWVHSAMQGLSGGSDWRPHCGSASPCGRYLPRTHSRQVFFPRFTCLLRSFLLKLGSLTCESEIS